MKTCQKPSSLGGPPIFGKLQKMSVSENCAIYLYPIHASQLTHLSLAKKRPILETSALLQRWGGCTDRLRCLGGGNPAQQQGLSGLGRVKCPWEW